MKRPIARLIQWCELHKAKRFNQEIPHFQYHETSPAATHLSSWYSRTEGFRCIASEHPVGHRFHVAFTKSKNEINVKLTRTRGFFAFDEEPLKL